MVKRLVMMLSGAATIAAATLVGTAPAAHAAPDCADVEVVFARGTVETAPPVGVTGLSLVAALRNELPGKSVSVHAVNYPASANFQDRVGIVEGVVKGVNDAQRRIAYLAKNCPNTDVVVGGYSQGAVVASYTVTDGIQIPAQYMRYSDRAPKPMAASVGKHVRAVILFAPPSDRWIRDIGAPPMKVGKAYQDKTKRYCITGDTVCNGAPIGQPNPLHVLYAANGDTINAAQYVKARL